MRRPTSKDHQGAQAVDSRVDGGMAARLRATSHWTTRSARTSGEPGVVEQVAQDRRRGAERQRARSRGTAGAASRKASDVAAEDRDVVARPGACSRRNAGGPARVPLQSDDIDVRVSPKRSVQRAAPGADLDDGSPVSKAASATSWSARSGRRKFVRDCAVARPAASACPRTRTITAVTHTTIVHRDATRVDRVAEVRSTAAGQRCRRSATVRPLDLTFDVGPHERVVSLPTASADSARVMITNATVHRTKIVLSLARNPASSWSSSGVMADDLSRVRRRAGTGGGGRRSTRWRGSSARSTAR